MNILMISDVYFPRINGVSTSMRTFRQELENLGHHVAIIAPQYGAHDDDDVIRIPSRSLPLDPEDRLMRLGEIMALKERLRHRRFDLVHVQTPFVAHYAGLRLARDLGIPCVETYHTLFEEYFHHYLRSVPKKWLRLATRRFSRWQCNALDGLVVPSRPMLERLLDYGVHARTAVIPTGIELDEFKAGNGDSFRSRHGIPPTRPMLLFVGRVAHEKNIGFLLRVLDEVRRTLPNVLLVIAGEGPAREALNEQALQLNLHNNLKFIGYLDRRTTLKDCYQAADLFVFASRTETQGLVLLEAMAAGLPVVSTAEMGTRDVLVHRRGALIAPEDVREFSEQVLRALKDADLRALLKKSGPEYAAEWSASGQAAKLEVFYEKTRLELRTCPPGANPPIALANAEQSQEKVTVN